MPMAPAGQERAGKGCPTSRCERDGAAEAGKPQLPKRYYLVSDLHMGGDGQLQHCDYATEFVAFLKELEHEGPDTELLIVGDTFGFWELTRIRGTEKLDYIVGAHQAIFDQLRITGARIKVTMMVGNHDYDLACNPAFKDKLRAYNIELDTSLNLIRTVGDRKIWIEHGQQRDSFNAFPEYGDPYALPVGYFITETFVSGASLHSDFGRGDWLKDIRSVGTTQIPDWVLSNYFYREMSTVLRWVLLPFLLLAGVTIVSMAGELLRVLGIFDYNVLFHNPVMSRLGIIDNVLQVVITINSIFLVLFGVPGALVLFDLKRTLRRFRVLTSHGVSPDLDPQASYLQGAQEVFAADDKVMVFVFGHTHATFLKRLGPAGQVVLNTGTWLKLLSRVPVRFGLLPAVYYPSYRLNYFRIEGQDRRLVIDYVDIPKTPGRELTWLQWLMTWRKNPAAQEPIPAKTIIEW
jgi:UDP-2,3-diacylglucosamine pyrophosphatase LpxH